MKRKLTRSQIQIQIAEMWDAVNRIPINEPDRDSAINQAIEAENALFDRYNKQEQLSDAAPDLLEALQKIINSYDASEDNIVDWALIDEARSAIKKATE